MYIREFTIADYDQAIAFWSAIEGLKLNESDTQEAVATFLERNPGFSAVALDDAGRIVGAVLCGHNGRAGSLHHLAVALPYRGKGLGRALANYCQAKLSAAQIPRCNIFVYTNNGDGNRFWLKNGWVDPTTWKVMQKII